MMKLLYLYGKLIKKLQGTSIINSYADNTVIVTSHNCCLERRGA